MKESKFVGAGIRQALGMLKLKVQEGLWETEPAKKSPGRKVLA